MEPHFPGCGGAIPVWKGEDGQPMVDGDNLWYFFYAGAGHCFEKDPWGINLKVLNMITVSHAVNMMDHLKRVNPDSTVRGVLISDGYLGEPGSRYWDFFRERGFERFILAIGDEANLRTRLREEFPDGFNLPEEE
jgi:hypothetical protein